jgi:hypothetical protein
MWDSPTVMLMSLSLPAYCVYFEVLTDGRYPRRAAAMNRALMISRRRRSMPVSYFGA